MKITTAQLRQIIKEEVSKHRSINEANLSDIEKKVGDLYAWGGIKTKYSSDIIDRYGKDVVDTAIKMAPKILAYQKKLKSIVDEIKKSKEANILLAMLTADADYSGGGRFTDATISDLFKLIK